MSRSFRGLSTSRGPGSSYDAVVIGAGIGGLICANLLARHGLRVLLVEQHSAVGGYCSAFRRQGFVFDAASHFYPLLGNPASITGKLLLELGVETHWIKMDPVDQFHFPDGSSFSVPADFDAYLARLKREFPAEADALDRFFELARKLYLLGVLDYFRGTATNRLDPYRNMTLREALDGHFQSVKLKLLLSADCAHWGAPPCRTSFVFDSMLRLAYFLGNYYPRGGSQAFANELAQRFEAQGGQILLKTSVRQILTKHNTAYGVELETGPRHSRRPTIVHADAVISNADLRQTLEQMVGAEKLDSHYLARVRDLRPSYPCFLAHLGIRGNSGGGLRGVSIETLRRVHGYHWGDWNSDRVGQDAFHFKLFVPTLYDPQMAPTGCHVLIVQKVTQFDYAAIDDWAAHKASIERFVMGHLERLIPGIGRATVVRLSASAKTSHRFTLNHHGAMLGWEMSPDQLGESRPDIATPVERLFLVGHWTRPGGGITPVIASALEVAERITRQTPTDGRTAPLGHRTHRLGSALAAEVSSLTELPLAEVTR